MTQNTYKLTEKQIGFYRTNGFVMLDDVFSPEEIAEMKALTDEVNTDIEKDLPPVNERDPYSQVFLQVVNVWKRDKRFEKFTLSEKLGGIAKKLLGADKVRLWHDHLMTKAPGAVGKATDWHQDFPYWPMEQPGPLSIWIPMQDVDLENGCMHFVPGSHDWGLNEVIYLDREEEKQDIFDLVYTKKQPLEVQRSYVPLKAGSVTFHNGLTLHFAGKNHSNEPRRVLSIIYMPDGEIYNGNPHAVSDGLGLEPGKPFEGEMFPVLA